MRILWQRHIMWLLTLVLCVIAVWFQNTRGPLLDTGATLLATSSVSNTRSSPAPALPQFSDQTLTAGLLHAHAQGDAALGGLPETLGPGACALDVDNDGWVDLFAVGGSGVTRFYGRPHWWQNQSGHHLYRNRGDGHFQDVTERAGLGTAMWGMGCASADLDNDGDQDLLVTGYGGNVLYRNNGDATFTDVTREAGLTGDAWSTSVAIGDYDQDGLLDIYIVNYLRYVKGAKTFEPHEGFDLGSAPAFNSQLYDGAPNQLLHNRGNLRFDDATQSADVADASGRGLSAMWKDFNHDRYPDLLVLNDGGFPHRLFINDRRGHFNEQSAAYRLSAVTASASVAAGDLAGRGADDLVFASTASALPKMLSWDSAGNARDDARLWGLADERNAGVEHWTTQLADFNNDGWLDLLMVNGLRPPDPLTARVAQGQALSLWLNRGGEMFEPVAATQSTASDALRDHLAGRGAAIADFDNNGTLDLYIAANNDLGQLLRNDTPPSGHFIGVQLVAKQGNRDAMNSSMTVRAGSMEFSRSLLGGGTFLSQGDRRLHVGLGAYAGPVTVLITWPDGTNQTLEQVATDRYLRITQDDPVPLALPGARAPKVAAGTADEDATTVQVAAIAERVAHPGERDLAELTEALNASSPLTRTFAITAIGTLNNEASMRWLLRMFSDPDATTRVALAHTLEGWYRDEKVMIHRKWLALPSLIRLLDDKDLDVRVAGIAALGASEHYRAVYPLVARLDDVNPRVQAAAACALGHARQREAIATLRDVARATDRAPMVRAHALIALRRLNDEALDTLWHDLARVDNSEHGGSHYDALLDIARNIVNDARDGVVFNSAIIAQRAQAWFTAARTTGEQSPLSPTARLAYLDVIERTAFAGAMADVRTLTRDNDAEVRARASVVATKLSHARDARAAL